MKDEPFTAAATAPIVDGLPEQQELADDKARHERPEGVRSSQMDLSHSPGHPPGEIVTNIDPGGHSGEFSVWLGKAQYSGNLRPRMLRLFSRLLDIRITP